MQPKIVRVMMVILTGVVIGGCVNLPAVRTYADETAKLSAAFEPMLGASVSSCTNKYAHKKLITSIHFDPVAVEKAGKELCAPIKEENKAISSLNSLLEQYATTMAALADDKLPIYKTETDGLAASFGKLKRPGTEQNLIPKEKLTAIASLGELLGRLATQHKQEEAIRDLLKEEMAVSAIVDALRDYAVLNYQAWLSDEEREMKTLLTSLKQSEKEEPLASRYVANVLFSEKRKVEERTKAVEAFISSTAKLKKAHSELRKKLNVMNDRVLLEKLIEFAEEVKDVRKKVSEAI
uniref:Lipoprotein n=1 Tax=Candidatus Kentrum sp. LPFa TaxID=2126335 RepID=A0A450XWZ3_9GAMM|nr:MAG: hypothetical protein BECKLPF1236A_GA0070988_102236 [Candidatus Kentron sp. LPFa]VFK33800.1 MAG: hypothetical protein BECKLPF1236C_GA0070990_102246 [Candidatus Kentron sp. LPFa]